MAARNEVRELAGADGTGYLSSAIARQAAFTILKRKLLRQTGARMRIIAGEAHGRRLRAPRGLHTRPTSARARESIFSRLAVRMDLASVRVLDIFAGSGPLGIQSPSLRAAPV